MALDGFKLHSRPRVFLQPTLANIHQNQFNNLIWFTAALSNLLVTSTLLCPVVEFPVCRFSVSFPYCHVHKTTLKLTSLRCTLVISEIFQLQCPIFFINYRFCLKDHKQTIFSRQSNKVDHFVNLLLASCCTSMFFYLRPIRKNISSKEQWM